MKSKSVRDMILFCVFGILVLGAMIFGAVRWEGNLPAYSVLNKSGQGFSVYMETLQVLGMDARQINAPVEDQPSGTIQIVATGRGFDAAEARVQKWIRSGGTLVLAAPDPNKVISGGSMTSENNGIRTYRIGSGAVLTIPAASLTNRTLTKDTLPSWALTTELMALGDRPVLFNERILFPTNETPSLWKAAPLWMKLAAYQLLIAACAWFWMKGRRLGKPLPFTAETERTELEYLKAAAHFYQAAGCWNLMLGAYFRSLIRLLGAKEDDWFEIWKREGLPDLPKAEALQRWMENIPPGCSHKEIQQQIMVIEHLKNRVRNRRHNPWNIMKNR